VQLVVQTPLDAADPIVNQGISPAATKSLWLRSTGVGVPAHYLFYPISASHRVERTQERRLSIAYQSGFLAQQADEFARMPRSGRTGLRSQNGR